MTSRTKFLIIGNIVIFGFAGVLGLIVGGKKMSNRGTTSVASPLEVAFSDACKLENDGKVIAVKGYLGLGGTTRCRMNFGQQGCYLSFSDKTYKSKDIEAYVPVGTDPGTMDHLRSDYTSSDLRVHTTGLDVGDSDYVRIVGEVSAPSDGLLGVPICSMTVSAVEPAQRPAAAPTPAEVKPAPTPQGKRK